jgi:hypothetical protein
LSLDRPRLSINERVQPGKQGYRNAQQQAQAYESHSHDQVQGCDRKPRPRIFPLRVTTKVLTFSIS